MSSLLTVAFHRSQFPEQVKRDLLESLRRRQVNHKFHYDSVKQTQKWLALHEAYSPSRTDPDCLAMYDRSFTGALARIDASQVHLLGLGCGGGQKDARLLRLLQDAGKQVSYTPSDVSAAMVLVAAQRALELIPKENCFPLVCDLATSETLEFIFDERQIPQSARLVTFFGMIPNFEPQLIVPSLAGLLRPGDYLLLSANLAPGSDYAAGVQRIVPLYDNSLTRDWLMSFLLDLGTEKSDGDLRFVVEEDPKGLKRAAAYYHFTQRREIEVAEQRFEFQAGDSVRLFFSYRHTPELVQRLLDQHGLRLLEQWITQSQEEGVFLACREQGGRSSKFQALSTRETPSSKFP